MAGRPLLRLDQARFGGWEKQVRLVKESPPLATGLAVELFVLRIFPISGPSPVRQSPRDVETTSGVATEPGRFSLRRTSASLCAGVAYNPKRAHERVPGVCIFARERIADEENFGS